MALLFYVNALFDFPPGPTPVFSNISLAQKQPDGSWRKHPRAQEIMREVNNYLPNQLRYAPSSTGTDGLELYFTIRVPEPVVSGIFVSRRNSINDPFGPPQRIPIPLDFGSYLEPEAPTISPSGDIMMFSRLDCESKVGCIRINIYALHCVNFTDGSWELD